MSCVRVEQTDTPFTAALRHAARCCSCRSPTARATTSRAPDGHRASSKPSGQVVFRYCDAAGDGHRRGQPERLAQQHRRHLQRGAQRRRADAASRACLRGGRSAAPTDCVMFESVIGRAGRPAARLPRGGVTSPPMTPDRLPLSSSAHGLTPDEYDRIVRAARPRAEPDRARHLLGDVVGALQLQELAHPSEDAADRPGRACCRARARTPAPSTSATAWRPSSRSNRTTTRRSSSRTRARRPASAASSATSSPWARGRSRC